MPPEEFSCCKKEYKVWLFYSITLMVRVPKNIVVEIVIIVAVYFVMAIVVKLVAKFHRYF